MGLESEFIEWLRDKHQPTQSEVLVGLGDDGAVWESAPGPKVFVSDSIAEGTHFLLPDLELNWVGRKAIAVNFSDVAAMGGVPEVATLNLQCPQTAKLDDLKSLFSGAKDICDRYGVALVGGDTNVWNQGWVVSVTVMGRLAGNQIWKMNTANPEDLVIVSGRFGGSIHGHHYSFQPRVDLSQSIAPVAQVSAATDASDSLASDLHAILRASDCGAIIDLDKIPLSAAALQSSRPLDAALYDGEDFELILTMSSREWVKLSGIAQSADLTVIGRVTEFDVDSAEGNEKQRSSSHESGRLRTVDGKVIPGIGYSHG